MKYLLAFAALALLTVSACAVPRTHGKASGTPEDTTERIERAQDPVCGMMIGVGQSETYVTTYESREYRFCSKECLGKFLADPQKYATGPVAGTR